MWFILFLKYKSFIRLGSIVKVDFAGNNSYMEVMGFSAKRDGYNYMVSLKLVPVIDLYSSANVRITCLLDSVREG